MTSKINFKFYKYAFFISSLFLLGNIKAQTIGNWPDANGNPSNVLTGTSSALAIGVPFTLPPNPALLEAWGHIRYFPPPSIPEPTGLIVTKLLANSAQIGVGGSSGSGSDGAMDPNGPGITMEVQLPKYYYTGRTTQSNITLTSGSIIGSVPAIYGINGGMSPLIWGRLEEPASTQPGTIVPASNLSRFIVLPDGRAGFNISNPRGTLDVIHTGTKTEPTAIFATPGTQNISATDPNNPYGIPMKYSKHIAIFNNLQTGNYNGLVRDGDQAIIFTDGKNSGGANQSGSLVIAPWNQGNSLAGLRMDKDGNILFRGDFEIQGKLACNGFVSKPKWWPDYVFDDKYSLLTLDSVQKFISINKHLPHMPSADSIINNGVDVPYIQILQQQKIEELTLYLIEQNSILQDQKTIIYEYERTLIDLAKRIDQLEKRAKP